MKYKKKHQNFKTSRNHSNNCHEFCHGRLDTYYMHDWLSTRDPNLLELIIEELPKEVRFETLPDDNKTEKSSVPTKVHCLQQLNHQKRSISPLLMHQNVH